MIQPVVNRVDNRLYRINGALTIAYHHFRQSGNFWKSQLIELVISTNVLYDPPPLLTGQLADTPTRALPTRGLDNWRAGQVGDWTTRGWHRRLCVLSFGFWPLIMVALCNRADHNIFIL